MYALVQLTREAAVVVAGNMRWMAWNFVLAVVPLALAVRLFRGRVRGAGSASERSARSAGWWAGVVAFVLFLPNAPYVLTDIIHLFDDARVVPSNAVLSFAVLPQYALFIVAGVAAYIVSVVLAEQYVGAGWVRPAAHGLSAVGIYVGRVLRVNSWDLVLHPAAVGRAVASSFGIGSVLLLGIAFCTLTVLTDLAVWGWGVRRRLASAG